MALRWDRGLKSSQEAQLQLLSIPSLPFLPPAHPLPSPDGSWENHSPGARGRPLPGTKHTTPWPSLSSSGAQEAAGRAPLSPAQCPFAGHRPGSQEVPINGAKPSSDESLCEYSMATGNVPILST